jgi:hypothetical protein
MNSRLIALIMTLGCGAASAENAEQRLLRSWGMQMESDGSLRLTQPQSGTQAAARWSPDLSAYQEESRAQRNLQIEPVRLNPAAPGEITD